MTKKVKTEDELFSYNQFKEIKDIIDDQMKSETNYEYIKKIIHEICDTRDLQKESKQNSKFKKAAFSGGMFILGLISSNILNVQNWETFRYNHEFSNSSDFNQIVEVEKKNNKEKDNVYQQN